MGIFITETFFLFIIFIEENLHDLKNLKKMMRIKTTTEVQRLQLFYKIIDDFSSVKEFLSAFNGIVEFNIATLFLWSLLSICGVLLFLQTILVSV